MPARPPSPRSRRRSIAAIVALALLSLAGATTALAQERPQSTGPTLSREREREIRDSIRARSRVRFDTRDSADATAGRQRRGRRYEPDRALLMPAMERSAIFRIGIPGWALRLGLRAGRQGFDSDEEYRGTRELLRALRSVRVAAFADNGVYEPTRLLHRYERYIQRRPRHEPVLYVRAPGGGVQIHVKERRGKVKRISLLAYGAEGAAVIRVKSRFTVDRLREAIELLTRETDDALGIDIDTAPH